MMTGESGCESDNVGTKRDKQKTEQTPQKKKIKKKKGSKKIKEDR